MSKLVLVIDDDDVVKESLVDVLRAADYRVMTAPDGESALRILEALEHPPSLILMDMVMPRMDGSAFLQKKAGMTGLAGIPVLVLTAGRCEVSGPDVVGLLRKPFDLNDLNRFLPTA